MNILHLRVSVERKKAATAHGSTALFPSVRFKRHLLRSARRVIAERGVATHKCHIYTLSQASNRILEVISDCLRWREALKQCSSRFSVSKDQTLFFSWVEVKQRDVPEGRNIVMGKTHAHICYVRPAQTPSSSFFFTPLASLKSGRRASFSVLPSSVTRAYEVRWKDTASPAWPHVLKATESCNVTTALGQQLPRTNIILQGSGP